ncbi:NADPH-dependent FMN reductase [Candidatus Nitrosocosmicus arcticus]|uniref:NADH-dependent FMN reductase n=1 Tax=Candidatus Nitrosocosmicus arcticus TaxID=2035267 RepID=A0A557SV29_9ARCH|nr:NAD(P)H-dependent oxidoreductase [Candidatus Nitrosocosmicus arcticus]TVP40464.1 NADH-dependent FMN reductase [Candidatus Nitrosocosmicus arcticus]
MTIKLLGIAGSMRSNSYSFKALEHALKIAKNNYNAEINLFDLRKNRLPIYEPNLNHDQIQTAEKESLQMANTLVQWADAIILSSPDYHGSMSGVIKNFLDYFWKEFSGKTFGYICASHEKGLTVMEQMRTAVRQCYGWSMPYGISTSSDDFDDAGNITNKKTLLRIEMLSRDIVYYGKAIRNQFLTDASNKVKESYSFLTSDKD